MNHAKVKQIVELEIQPDENASVQDISINESGYLHVF
jgi:hypothetical protein